MEKLRTTPNQAASSAPSTDDLQRSRSRSSLILRCQRIIFSCYRADQYSDPDGYMDSLGAVLEQYPNDVIVYITDPRSGVQRHHKWPPTISEIVEACDNRIAELKRNERYRNWGKNDQTLLQGPQVEKPTIEQLKAKYGPNWGIGDIQKSAQEPPRQAPGWNSIVAMYGSDPSLLQRLLPAASPAREAANG